MQRLIINFGCFILAAAAIVVTHAGCEGDIDKAPPKIALDALRFTVLFEKNRGQTSKSIRYLARGSGFNFFLKQDEVILSLARAPKQAPISRKGFENARRRQPIEMVALRIGFPGANPNAKITATDGRNSSIGHYTGRDSSRWLHDIPAYGNVHYQNLYSGIDLSFRASKDGLTYRFRLAPGTSPRPIALLFKGADTVVRGDTGDLIVTMSGETVRFGAPLFYQWQDGERQAIAGRYVVRGKTVGFKADRFDRKLPLFIDPGIDFATAIGGMGIEGGTGVLLDTFLSSKFYGETLSVAVREEAGTTFAYVAGGTQSADLDETGATVYQGSWDGFIQKLDVTGAVPVVERTIYLSGGEEDVATAVALGDNGAVYVTGLTASTGTTGVEFPAPEAPETYQSVHGGEFDAFLTRLDADLNIQSSSFFGGAGIDLGYALAVVTGSGPSAGIYLAGTTSSESLQSEVAPLIGKSGSFYEGFVTKFDLALSSVAYMAFIGGCCGDEIWDIAVRNGAAHVTGYTNSHNFPNVNGVQRCVENTPIPNNTPTPDDDCETTPIAGPRDAFVVKLNAAGDEILFSTAIGGLQRDYGRAIAVDNTGMVYVAGEASITAVGNPNAPTNFPLVGNPVVDNTGKVFFAVLSIPDGSPENSALVYATKLRGSRFFDIAVDPGGRVYLGGRSSYGFAPLPPFNVTDAGTGDDGIVASLLANSSALDAWDLDYWALFRGTGTDQVVALARGAGDTLFAGGFTTSSDFETGGAQTGSFTSGGSANFLVRMDASPPPPQVNLTITKILLTPPPYELGDTLEYLIEVTNNGDLTATNVRVSDNLIFGTLPADDPLIGSNPPVCTYSGGTVDCNQLGDIDPGQSVSVTLSIKAASLGTLANEAFAGADEPDADESDNAASASIEIVPQPPGLAVSKTGVHDPATGTATWTISVTSTSPTDSVNAELVDTLPAEVQSVTFVVPPPQCEVTGAPGTYAVECGLGTVAEDDGDVVVIQGMLGPIAPGSDPVCNEVEVSADGVSPVTLESPQCFEAPPLPEPPALSIDKQFTIDSGTGAVTTTLHFWNDTAAGPAENVRVRDVFPPAVVPQIMPANCVPVAGSVNEIECGPYQMPPGDTEFINISGQIVNLAPGTEELCNTVVLTADGSDDVEREVCSPAPAPELEVQLENLPAEAAYRENFPNPLVVRIKNNSKLATAPNVGMTLSTTPEKLVEINNPTGTQGGCPIVGDYSLECSVGDIGPEAEAEFGAILYAAGVSDETGQSEVEFRAEASSLNQTDSDTETVTIVGPETDLSVTINPPEELSNGTQTLFTIVATAAPEPAPFVRLDLVVRLEAANLSVESANVLLPGGGGKVCQVTPSQTESGNLLVLINCQFADMSEGTSIIRINAPLSGISRVSAEVSGFVREPTTGVQDLNTAEWLPP